MEDMYNQLHVLFMGVIVGRRMGGMPSFVMLHHKVYL